MVVRWVISLVGSKEVLCNVSCCWLLMRYAGLIIIRKQRELAVLVRGEYGEIKGEREFSITSNPKPAKRSLLMPPTSNGHKPVRLLFQ